MVSMALPGLLKVREQGEKTGLGLEAGVTGVNRRRQSQHSSLHPTPRTINRLAACPLGPKPNCSAWHCQQRAC